MSVEPPPISFLEWSWVVPTIGAAVVGTILTVAYFFVRRWYQRRGKTDILINDRMPGEYITRGRWDVDRQGLVQDSPRFMNFRIPLTITNRREVDLAIRVGTVSFSQGRPVFEQDGMTLPGTNLHQSGLRVENAAGQITDPFTIAPHGIASVVLIGTASTPVCHAGPFMDWRYVVIEWETSPVDLKPLVLEIDRLGAGRSFDPDLEPYYPLPPHYPEMQARGSVPGQAVPYSWSD